ncbi:CBS domain-containing protein [Rhodococcus rhodochrous]|uniref:CBS domain-containing protein n=1 Tax=Rhodococcus rhodochrous TaxID=1829 RepID=UPI0020B14ACC|nr:CBS domain-containing protein [Rhodococcus rhodochrous]
MRHALGCSVFALFGVPWVPRSSANQEYILDTRRQGCLRFWQSRRVSIDEALRIMRETRKHLATVADDGSVVGLITLNDVLTRLMPAASSAA